MRRLVDLLLFVGLLVRLAGLRSAAGLLLFSAVRLLEAARALILTVFLTLILTLLLAFQFRFAFPLTICITIPVVIKNLPRFVALLGRPLLRASPRPLVTLLLLWLGLGRTLKYSFSLLFPLC